MSSSATIRIEMSPKLQPCSRWWIGLKQVLATHGYLRFDEAMVCCGEPREWHFVACEKLDDWSDNTRGGLVVWVEPEIDQSREDLDAVRIKCVWNSEGMQFLRILTQFSMGQVAYLPADIAIGERIQRLAFELHQFHGALETKAFDDYSDEPLFRFTRDKLEYMAPLQVLTEESRHYVWP